MPPIRLLRVVTFSAPGPESPVDAALREVVVPELLRAPEVVGAWIGRTGTGTPLVRLMASTWSAIPSAAEPTRDVSVLEHPALLAHGRVSVEAEEQAEVVVHASFDRSDPARILRVFRGRANAGELDAYVEEARAGMAADSDRIDGLVSFVLGTRSADEFLTVSAWTNWAAIEAATGGSTRNPAATRNARRLHSYAVGHHEILPEAPERRPAE